MQTKVHPAMVGIKEVESAQKSQFKTKARMQFMYIGMLAA